MNESDQKGPEESHYREMTVAQIREPKGADAVTVAFFQSARFHRLLRINPACERILKLLRDSMSTGRILKVRFESRESDVIENVT
jgi:hypothetical protein